MASAFPEVRESGRDTGNDLPEFHIDPYEVAYLRGGSRELLKLRLFELMQKGCLIVIEKKRWYGTDRWLAVAADLQNWSELAPADQHLLEMFRHPRTSKEIFNLTFPQELESACRRNRQELMQRGMLAGRLAPEDFGKSRGGPLAFLTAVTFIILGDAHYWEHYWGKDRYRLTDSGEQYLKGLQRQFQFLANFGNTARVGAVKDMLLYLSASEEVRAVAIFGLGILANSPFDALAETLSGKTSQGMGDYGSANAGGCDGSADPSCGG